jgi:DNA-binding SARP family transcriptional activator/predicted ATPase
LDRVFVRLLGPPSIRTAVDEVQFLAPERRTQLLAFLALQRQWVGRERLASLFWPDRPDSSARGNLRFTLAQVKRLPWAGGVAARTDALRWDAETDVHQFDLALDRGDRGAAIDIYGGPLLDGFEVAGPAPFVQWLCAERRRLAARWRDATLEYLSADAAPELARTLCARLLAADPLDERALQVYLRALLAGGQAAQAGRVYQEFARRLAEELGIEPSAETRALHRLPGSVGTVSGSPGPTAAQPAAAGFVGRIAERRRLAALLAQECCRLVMVLGIGGIGKSRLVSHMLPELTQSFPDGAVFVSLEHVEQPTEVIARLARALRITMRGSAPALEQLIGHLRTKRTLLVLDNFEHLSAAAAQVQALLDGCAALKLLVTSRQRLGLAQEVVLVLDGLPFASVEDDARALEFDATRLFIDRAQRVSGAFDATSELPDIARICRLVEGMPLALEVAAAWTRLLPCREIAEELGAGAEILRAEDPDRPPRQASVDAALAHSWTLMAQAERDVLARVSVFRGGFTREAASEVAGASLPVLAALIDKSLLAVERGRFRFHPMVAQFAERALRQQGAERAVRTRHARHFARFLGRLELADGQTQSKAVLEVEQELDNVLSAWHDQIGQGRTDLFPAAVVLARYFGESGRVLEGIAVLSAADQVRHAGDVATAPVWRALSMLENMCGRYEAAEHHARRALRAFRTRSDRTGIKGCLNVLGLVAWRGGRLEAAARCFDQGMRLARADDDRRGIDVFRVNRALVAKAAGDPARAVGLLRESLAAARAAGDVARELNVSHNLASGLIALGQLDAAESVLSEAIQASARRGFAFTRRSLLSSLAGVVFERGQLERAARLARDALDLLDPGASEPHFRMNDLLLLARVDIARNYLGPAIERVAEAIAEARAAASVPLLLACTVQFGEWLLAQGDARDAHDLLAIVLRHPAAAREDRTLSGALLQRAAIVVVQVPYVASRDDPLLQEYATRAVAAAAKVNRAARAADDVSRESAGA